MTPLRTIHLAGFPLRIYASPLTVPDHPWASFDDLATLATMDDIDRDRWLEHVRRDVPDMLHEAPGQPTLVAEPMVSGLFYAWATVVAATGISLEQDLLDQWIEAWVELFCARYAHLSQDEFWKVIQQAGLRNMPNVLDTTVMQ